MANFFELVYIAFFEVQNIEFKEGLFIHLVGLLKVGEKFVGQAIGQHAKSCSGHMEVSEELACERETSLWQAIEHLCRSEDRDVLVLFETQ